jgi:2-(1,2-epoxy-1,2-dihydrophenyl)acetyl-CoA isomerase
MPEYATILFEVKDHVAHLTFGPTKAFWAGKRLMHAGWTETLESQIEQGLRNIAVMSRTEDAREAIAAFAAKRTPQFKGR